MSVGKRNGTAALPLPLPATGLVGVKSTAPAVQGRRKRSVRDTRRREREREREREKFY
jgi:hypothetical protein